MLGKRITEARKYISLYDPALYEAKAADAARYRVTRDIDDLGDFKTWPVQPTIFTLLPLQAGYGHLADDMGFMARRQLFMLHVTKVEGWDPECGALEWEPTPNKQMSLSAESVALFGDEIVDDIATVIVELAQSDTTPFSLPDSFREYLRNTSTSRAMAAVRTANCAKEKSSD